MLSVQETLRFKAQGFQDYLRRCSAIERLIELEVQGFKDIQKKYDIDTGANLVNLQKHLIMLKRLLTGTIERGTTGNIINKTLAEIDRATQTEKELRGTTQLKILNFDDYQFMRRFIPSDDQTPFRLTLLCLCNRFILFREQQNHLR